VLNGILLPIVLVSMIMLINNKKIMGNYTNKPFQNIIGWGAVAILVVLSVVLLIMPFLGK
jgi:Mn2+/Fe2+ NRAMP family transporter